MEESQHLSKAQKREMYAAALAQAAVHQEADRYEEDNVGVQALNEGSKTAERLPALGKSRYAQKLQQQKLAELAGILCDHACGRLTCDSNAFCRADTCHQSGQNRTQNCKCYA